MVAKLKVSLDATHTSEYIAWLQVEIKAGGMRRFASDMSEMAAHVCFVGLFVAAETGVAVNPEHGAAIAPGKSCVYMFTGTQSRSRSPDSTFISLDTCGEFLYLTWGQHWGQQQFTINGWGHRSCRPSRR